MPWWIAGCPHLLLHVTLKLFDNLNFASLQSNIDFLKLQKFVKLGKNRIFYPNLFWLEMFFVVLELGVENSKLILNTHGVAL